MFRELYYNIDCNTKCVISNLRLWNPRVHSFFFFFLKNLNTGKLFQCDFSPHSGRRLGLTSVTLALIYSKHFHIFHEWCESRQSAPSYFLKPSGHKDEIWDTTYEVTWWRPGKSRLKTSSRLCHCFCILWKVIFSNKCWFSDYTATLLRGVPQFFQPNAGKYFN